MVHALAPQEILEQIFDTAVKADGAGKGTLQVFNRSSNGLEIIAHRGFDEEFLETFRFVHADKPCCCGRALRFKRRVIISDVRADLFFSPFLAIAAQAGYRAVQSTPIIGADGEVIGILSTHFASVHRLSTQAAKILDECAARLAEVMADGN